MCRPLLLRLDTPSAVFARQVFDTWEPPHVAVHDRRGRHDYRVTKDGLLLSCLGVLFVEPLHVFGHLAFRRSPVDRGKSARLRSLSFSWLHILDAHEVHIKIGLVVVTLSLKHGHRLINESSRVLVIVTERFVSSLYSFLHIVLLLVLLEALDGYERRVRQDQRDAVLAVEGAASTSITDRLRAVLPSQDAQLLLGWPL